MLCLASKFQESCFIVSGWLRKHQTIAQPRGLIYFGYKVCVFYHLTYTPHTTHPMSLDSKSEYTFQRFERSSRPTKKYAAILKSKSTGRLVTIHFGATGYSQYKDRALGLYSSLDHKDKKRRANYRSRHTSDIDKAYSASWFALKYLW